MKKHNFYTNLFFGLNIKTMNADIALNKVAISYLRSNSSDNSFNCWHWYAFSAISSVAEEPNCKTEHTYISTADQSLYLIFNSV